MESISKQPRMNARLTSCGSTPVWPQWVGRYPWDTEGKCLTPWHQRCCCRFPPDTSTATTRIRGSSFLAPGTVVTSKNEVFLSWDLFSWWVFPQNHFWMSGFFATAGKPPTRYSWLLGTLAQLEHLVQLLTQPCPVALLHLRKNFSWAENLQQFQQSQR